MQDRADYIPMLIQLRIASCKSIESGCKRLGMELESVLLMVEKLGLEPCFWCTPTARMYLSLRTSNRLRI